MDDRTLATPRRRYAPEERRKMILDGAIDFFAEHGLDGSTHALAKYLGVTQPLIYQYFPCKEDLIDAVYEQLFKGRWNGRWDAILTDRSRRFEDRLHSFYADYVQVMHAPEWIRIYLYSGLRNLELNQRYNPIIEERVIDRFCCELRHELGLPEPSEAPLRPEEREATWVLHSGLFYYGVRRYVYRLPITEDTDTAMRAAVTVYLAGMPALYARLGLMPA